jgi:hypothetical protein
MTPQDVAIATITWARTPSEEGLLARSLTLLSQAGLPVAVADRGTSRSFGETLARLPGFSITVPAGQGLAAQVAASIELAARWGRPFILYVEPDKEIFFGPRMSEFLRRAPEEDNVGVVLASRTGDSYATYPPMQRYTEGVINHLCGELIGVRGDYSYGPFLIGPALLSALGSLDSTLGWGWRHYAFLTAHRRGLRVHHIADDYPCPPDQREEDDAERVHRMRQLSQNILGLIAP